MSIYDKRDDFPFDIISFPNLSGNVHFRRSHGVIVGQLIRFSKRCDYGSHFSMRTSTLTHKLIGQGFDKKLLEKYCSKFFTDRPHLLRKYKITTKQVLELSFKEGDIIQNRGQKMHKGKKRKRTKQKNKNK